MTKSPDVSNILLRNCRRPVDPFEALQIIVDYIAVWQDGEPGDVGTENGKSIFVSPGDIVVGHIFRQNFTTTGILAITMTLLVLSFVLHAFVPDDNTEVVACMLRERTGQEATTPTVAMGDGEVNIKRSFNEETQEWYVGTIIPDGYEEKAERELTKT